MSRLKQDLMSLDAVLNDFIKRNPKFVPDAPSWKYPELTASKVDIKRCLASTGEADPNNLVLELLHDRTLFLLQCIFKCLLSGGTKPLVVPLSLGTTSKKLLKAIEDEAALKQQQPVVGTQGTSATGQHNPFPAKTGQGSLSCSVSVQTTETCLSLCANCIDMQKVLEQASTITSHAVDVCSNDTAHNSSPPPPSTHPTTSGVFDCQKWLTTFQGDMSKVVGLHKHMVDQCVRLGERVGALQLEVKRNQELLRVKEDELAGITREKEEIDATADQKRVELVDKHHSEMRAMESNILKLKNELGNFQNEMKQLHGSKIELLTMLSEKTNSVSSLESEVNLLRERTEELDLQLKSKQVELSDAKSSLRDQLERISQFEQLSASKETHMATLTQRLKALQNKHAGLIDHMETVECDRERLSTELQAALQEADSSKKDHEALSLQLAQVQSDLAKHKVELERASAEVTEYTELMAEMKLAQAELTAKLEQVQKDFSEAETKCRLLMDYPSLKPFGNKDHIRELSENDAQHHLSTNTVRILLLEEQNKDIRTCLVPSGGETGAHKLTGGNTKLWQPQLFQRASQQCQRPHSTDHRTEQRVGVVDSSSEPHLRSSTAKYKGHMGRLATALQSSYESHDRKYTPDYHAWS